MSRADLMYSALVERPGEFVSRRSLFRHADTFYLTNNAASEVRAKYGVDVEHDVVEGEHSYRLADLGAVHVGHTVSSPIDTPAAALAPHPPRGGGRGPEQLVLTTTGPGRASHRPVDAAGAKEVHSR